MFTKNLLYSALLAILFNNCATKTKSFVSTIPKEFYNKILVDPEISNMNMIANINVAELEKKANSNIAELLYEDNNITDDNYILKVWRKGDLKIIPKNGLIEIQLPLKIYAKALIDLGFFKQEKESTFEVIPSYITKISLSPDWKVITQTSANGYKWIIKPTINIGPVEIDAAPFIEKILNDQQSKIALEADKIIANSVNIKEYVENGWKILQTPIAISEKYNSWLTITPTDVFFIPIHGDDKTLKVGVSVKGKTETFVGEKPAVNYLPIPSLSNFQASDNTYNINLVARISFAQASIIAKQNLLKQEFATEKYKIKIDDIDFFGAGNNLVVKTMVSGDIDATIFLKGIPAFDSSSNSIIVQNLDFDLETKNKLFKVADWLSHGTFIKKMEKNLVFPLKTQTDEAKLYLQKLLTANKINDYVTLNGTVNSLTPKKIDIINEYFVLQIGAKGKIEMNLSGF